MAGKPPRVQDTCECPGEAMLGALEPLPEKLSYAGLKVQRSARSTRPSLSSIAIDLLRRGLGMAVLPRGGCGPLVQSRAAPRAAYHSRRQAKKLAFSSGQRRPTVLERRPQPPAAAELTYPMTHEPEFRLANGWTPPPETPPPDLPFSVRPPASRLLGRTCPRRPLSHSKNCTVSCFQVRRTARGRSLPVYTDYRNARSRVLTIVRNIDGDINEMQREMSKLCATPVVQRAGRLEVSGRHTTAVRNWLAGLGF